jgi:hypothetical protein
VALFFGGWLWLRRAERNEMEKINPWLRVARLREEDAEKFNSEAQRKLAQDIQNGKVVSSPTNSWLHNSLRLSDMTNEQKANLARLFTEKFRPALEHWSAAYSNHIPFNVADVTLDKFHSTLGSHMFTFMIGSTTLTFVESRESSAPAKVGYLMVRQAAVDMNSLPKSGFTPELTLPVTADEIIRMVKADSGGEFKPSEVIIRPTGKASALNGGAFVDLLPTGADPNNALNYKISMVFDAGGKLVNYERDPSF